MENITETPTIPPRPEQVPAKFWDEATGAIRVDALLKSYLALEKRLSAGAGPAPDRPDTPEDYCIDCAHGLFQPDPAINQRLHGAGFSKQQAQLLYDLAAERMLPLLGDMAGEFQAEREMQQLLGHFGGAEQWQEQAGQIRAWAERNLPPALVQALAATADGVKALHRMMRDGGAEPKLLRDGSGSAGLDSTTLNRMVADPRYWRERDPAFIAQVTEGFRRLYAG
ncbi:hypothetical protein [Niveispirillum sp. BGYR6]|jgi:hypothetical protein|uniref:capsid assembly protein n=1 Tax=Niveispirillum sp. BGYR6 TaxID=2971249 RepID=UPI0022B941E2|nr:hypothetical protein [Niveispirillum sp. BGYR6]MDG5495927.1 hypothetical protein [Niveispirillum sp. BGYR6]